MTSVLDYIGGMFIGNTYHFVCDCTFPIDFRGTVRSYEVRPSGEIVLSVQDSRGKVIPMGLNHPRLQVEEIG